MRKRRLLIALVFALGVLLVPVMAYADVSEVSPVNPHGKEVVIIKAYDLDAVIVKGQHLKLDVACGVAVSGSVNWSSSNESVATVASNGEVIGVADGTAKITAECSGFTDTLKVTVKTPKYVMTWSNAYGSENTYEYNAFGLQTRCVSDYGTDETDYNNYGLPTERRENGSYWNLRTTYTYDSLMNVTKAKNSDGEEATYKYDSFGRLTSFTDTMEGANDGATYDYESTKSGGIKVTETKWDLDDPSDKEVETYIYNKKGLLIKHTDDYVDTYKYDKKGRLIVMKTTSYGGVTEQVSYNKLGLEAKWVSTPC